MLYTSTFPQSHAIVNAPQTLQLEWSVSRSRVLLASSPTQVWNPSLSASPNFVTMTSVNARNGHLWVEPSEKNTSQARKASDRSDVSLPPSNDSESAESSMAADIELIQPAKPRPSRASKNDIGHVEVVPRGDNSATYTGAAEVPVDIKGTAMADSTQHKQWRKFVPEAIETSTRSSKKEKASEEAISPSSKRKFTPEPVETTSRSSKAAGNALSEDKTPKPRRKFAVEPVETTIKSSKDRDKSNTGSETSSKPRRRFAVEPVETSVRSSKEKDDTSKTAKPKRRFAPQPIETSTAHSRKHKEESKEDDDDPDRKSSGGRRFTPELVGTAKASFRKRQASAVPKWLKEEFAEDEGHYSAPEEGESKFSAAALARKARADPRRHSYSVPDLPMIQSDSSEDEHSATVTPATQSYANSRDRNLPKVNKKQLHQHIHDHNAQYLKTLREQAVAAYGAQEDHVPFGHYGGDSDNEDYPMSVGRLSLQDGADPHLFRRMSIHDLHLVQEEMRSHHDQLDKAKQELQEDTAGISRFSAAALAARHHLNIRHPTGSHYASRHDKQRNDDDKELRHMKKAASPPMAGNEIKFPFSVSPKMTRCDPDQMPRPRRANSEDEEEHDIGTEGMWSQHVSPMSSKPSEGLWGGFCQKDETGPTKPSTPLRSGIQTPATEQSNPFGTWTPARGSKTPKRQGGQLWGGSAFMPLTPPRSRNEKSNDNFTAALDKKLQLERQIDEDFPPRVITQIYNYLSLGYPPIARPFDEELSKISRISIAELRRDDRSDSGTARGHVGAPETEGDAVEDDDGKVKGCRRWEALRMYVREWARQSPLFQTDQHIAKVGATFWGPAVRRGSWGL